MPAFEWPVTGKIRSNDVGQHATLIKGDFDDVNDIAKLNLSLSTTLLPAGFESKIRKGIAKGLAEACSNGYCPNMSDIDKSIVRNVILKNVSTAAALEVRNYISLPAFRGLYDSYDWLYDKIVPQELRDKYNALRVKLTAQLPHASMTSHTSSGEEIISALGLVDTTRENDPERNLAKTSKWTVTHQQKNKKEGVNDKESEVHDAASVAGGNEGEVQEISKRESVLKHRKDGNAFTTTVNLKIEHQVSVNQMEAMTTPNLLSKLASSLRKFLRAQKFSSRSVTISSASLLDSGDVEVVVHSKTRKSLRIFDDAKGWSQAFETTLIGWPFQACKVMVHSINVQSLLFRNRKEKAAIIRDLTVANGLVGDGNGVETAIGDIYWAKDYSQKQTGSLIVEFLDSKQADQALERSIWWRGKRYPCGRTEEHLKLRRCSKCQGYGHVLKRCSGSYRCSICAGPHQAATCKSELKRCASCGGPHRAGSSGCPVKIDAKRSLGFTVEKASPELPATSSSQHAQYSNSATKTQVRKSIPLPASQDAISIRDEIEPEPNTLVPQAGPSKSTQSDVATLKKTVKYLQDVITAHDATTQIESSKRSSSEAFTGGADAGSSSYRGVKRIKSEPRSRHDSMSPYRQISPFVVERSH